MAKRKTIKNNPLDSLSGESPQEYAGGVEHILIGEDQPSQSASVKPTANAKPTVIKERKSTPPNMAMETVIEHDEGQNKKRKKESPGSLPSNLKKPTVEVPPDNLAHRVRRLEDDNRMQNIMIGIIMVPLAVLALLGAVPIP